MKRIGITFVLCACVVLTAWAQAPTEHTIIKFDVPGAGTLRGQGTVGQGIVDDGSVEGYYIDSNGVAHGFLRSPSGDITKFDALGGADTFPIGMNSTHSIVGFYLDSTGDHGFTRSPDGEIKQLNFPGAGKATGQYAVPENINDSGEIAGIYVNPKSVLVGFVVSAGKFTRFKAPGLGDKGDTEMPGFGGLTDAGAIALDGLDSNDVSHGYLRTPDGKFKEFDPVGSVNTYVSGINTGDTVVGLYTDSSGADRGFVREANGVITPVNVPNATYTSLVNINSSGASVGQYGDSSGLMHGFVLSPKGAISTFSVPGASRGTFPASNNAAGSITGTWIDGNEVDHGFVRK